MIRPRPTGHRRCESRIIIDANEDLAYNALLDGRDYLLSAYITRSAEEGEEALEDLGICMLGLPEWLQAQVAIIFATLTTIPRALAHPGELSYRNSEASHQQALAQLAVYRRWMATSPTIRLITHRSHLDETLATWEHDGASLQVGLVLLMENADSIRTPDEVGFWYEQGRRIVGPAWHSNRYTGSTIDGGPLTALGRDTTFGWVLVIWHRGVARIHQIGRVETTLTATKLVWLLCKERVAPQHECHSFLGRFGWCGSSTRPY